MEEFAAELDACLRELRTGAADSRATVITPPAPRPSALRARRRISPAPLLVALLALAALAVIAAAAIALRGNDSGEPGRSSETTAGGAAAVTLSAVGGYDPNGDATEHDSDAAKATDGDSTTYWTTEHYGNQDFGGLKDGVGLVLNAPQSVALEKLTVTSDTPGFTAIVKAGSSPQSAQNDSSTQTVNGNTTFDLNGLTGSVYVLWITRLATDGVAHVNGVTATG
jgi:hypothetical protein